MNVLDLDFMERAKAQNPAYFTGKNVLEIGALDVNGDVRSAFEDCTFTGVDWTPGKNVDIVVPAGETTFEPDSFDVLLSMNHLEHDPKWEDSLGHNLPALKSGGLILLRWCGPGSAPHSADADPSGEHGYYPKSTGEVTAWLEQVGMLILEAYGNQNPYIGPMCNVVAKKP